MLNNTTIQDGSLDVGEESFDDVEEVYSHSVQVFYYTISCVLILINFIMASLFVFYYKTKRIPQTSFNYYLVFYSLSNIGQCLAFIPTISINLKNVTTRDVYLQTFLCSISDGIYFYLVAMSCTAYILSYMTIARCCIIRKPFRRPLAGKSKFNISVIGVTCIAALCMLPNAFNFGLKRQHGFCVRTNLYHPMFSMVYGAFLTVCLLLVPVIVMLVTYAMIIKTFFNKHVGENTCSQSVTNHRKHVVKLLGALIFIYILCGFPLSIYWILSITSVFGTGIKAEYVKTRVFRLVLWPILLEGIFNVIFYALSSNVIRNRYLDPINRIKSNLRSKTYQINNAEQKDGEIENSEEMVVPNVYSVSSGMIY